MTFVEVIRKLDKAYGDGGLLSCIDEEKGRPLPNGEVYKQGDTLASFIVVEAYEVSAGNVDADGNIDADGINAIVDALGNASDELSRVYHAAVALP